MKSFTCLLVCRIVKVAGLVEGSHASTETDDSVVCLVDRRHVEGRSSVTGSEEDVLDRASVADLVDDGEDNSRKPEGLSNARDESQDGDKEMYSDRCKTKEGHQIDVRRRRAFR